MSILNNYIQTGEDPDKYLERMIQQNSQKWFILCALLILLWIGHHITLRQQLHKIQEIKTHIIQKDSINKIQAKQIDTLQKLVNNAVFFKDLK